MLRSKFVGCLVGSALGDALGNTYEGLRTPEVKMEDFSGRWTDDTHLMIGVAESLIRNKGFNARHMAETFIRNYDEEPWRGYGPGPPRVFKWIKSGVAWSKAAKRLYGGAGSYGNGAAMRVAPVGIFYYDDVKRLRAVSNAQSRITHTHELGMEGAALQAYAVALATKAEASSKLDLSAFLSELQGFACNEVYEQKLRKIQGLLDEKSKRRVTRELGNSVTAHNSVPTAIYSFLRNRHSLKKSVLYAISLGGDTDTIGAMTGAISGAYHGEEAIPECWKNGLESREHIEMLARKLWRIKSRE
ncbi:hypothetical protein GWN63_02840 [Candidatus Bathyarchaeota archaeon]|nr:hypothetical protein [Candidatus Bathyarchaeota archaeon]NIU81166.1 hypothetical protein [Candidatus Bathyarchaeota archaeon]NIV67792.1 hypothetical protein [Candidatus Bathyarchaeota archaeon]NIW16286.1 hypothetical protein [Candidatus Bathyarchaeota archaeon]NIW34404.1 hypothetical protein [Candidatus Bathyarchaeota archaeon]